VSHELEATDFSPVQNVQSCSGAHKASYSVSTGVISPEVMWPGGEFDQSAPSSAEVKNEWSYISTPLICLYCVDMDKFYLKTVLDESVDSACYISEGWAFGINTKDGTRRAGCNVTLLLHLSCAFNSLRVLAILFAIKSRTLRTFLSIWPFYIYPLTGSFARTAVPPRHLF
jgi:hypothetical protein